MIEALISSSAFLYCINQSVDNVICEAVKQVEETCLVNSNDTGLLQSQGFRRISSEEVLEQVRPFYIVPLIGGEMVQGYEKSFNKGNIQVHFGLPTKSGHSIVDSKDVCTVYVNGAGLSKPEATELINLFDKYTPAADMPIELGTRLTSGEHEKYGKIALNISYGNSDDTIQIFSYTYAKK